MSDTPLFFDKTQVPDLPSLYAVLGASAELWKNVEQFLSIEPGNILFQWKFYGKNSGWLLKVLCRKRNLFFLLPREGLIYLGFVFGEKAVNEILTSDFPETVKTSLSEARAYAEGRGMHFGISSDADLEVFKRLIKVKMMF